MLLPHGVKYLGISRFRTTSTETICYAINDPLDGGKFINDIVEYSDNTEDATPLENQESLYCLKANLGFNNINKIITYDVSYDIKDKDTFEKENEPLYQLANSSQYNKILTLLNIMYIPNQSPESYRKQLLEAAFKKYPVTYKTPITDTDIDAINQSLLWLYTNNQDIRFKNYNQTNWIYYSLDNDEYKPFSEYNMETEEGKDRAQQAESLYKYLLDMVESQTPSGNVVNDICRVILTEENDQINLMSEPNKSSSVVEVVNNEINVTRILKNICIVDGCVWDKIRLSDGREAYIDTNSLLLISNNETCKVVTVTKGDKISAKSEPNNGATTVTTLNDGTIVTRVIKNVANTNNILWDKIQLSNGQEAYVKTQFLQKTTINEAEENKKCKVVTFDAGSSVTIREAPDAHSDSMGVLHDGDVVTRIQKNVEYGEDGYVWDKICLYDGTEAYFRTQYLQVIDDRNPTQYDLSKILDVPLTIDTEAPVACEKQDSNYLIGPINIVKNNNSLCNMDFSIENNDSLTYQLLDNEKNVISEDDLVNGGNIYISIPESEVNNIDISFGLDYQSTETTVYASKENGEEQIVALPMSTSKNKVYTLQVDLSTLDNTDTEPEHKTDSNLDQEPSTTSKQDQTKNSQLESPNNQSYYIKSDKTVSPYPLANTGFLGIKILGILLIIISILAFYFYKKSHIF